MTGNIQWVCPNCGFIHGSVRAKWKSAALRCVQCQRKYRTGIGFASQAGGTVPPYNAVYAGFFNKFNANALENMPVGTPAIGRIAGRVDWICPSCSTPQATKTDWDLCSTDCLRCDKRWYLRLILWRSTPVFPVGTPYDWTPLVRGFYNSKSIKVNDEIIPVVRVDLQETSTQFGQDSQ